MSEVKLTLINAINRVYFEEVPILVPFVKLSGAQNSLTAAVASGLSKTLLLLCAAHDALL